MSLNKNPFEDLYKDSSPWDEPSPFKEDNTDPFKDLYSDTTPEPIEQSEMGEFRKGFGAGVDQVQALAGGAFALAGESMGNEFMFQRGLKYYQEQMQEAAAYNPKVASVYDVDLKEAIASGDLSEMAEGFNRTTDYLGYTFGNLIPQMGTVIAGGGVTGFIAKKTIENKIKKKVKEYTKEAIRKKVLLASSAGAYSISSSQIGGDTFMEIYEETGDRSVTEALVAGAVGGALDLIVPVRALKKVGGDALDDTLKHMVSNKASYDGIFKTALKNGGIEGVTEVLQESLTLAAIDVSQDPNTNWGKEFLINLAAEENRERLVNAAVAGTLMGGTVGGGIGVVDSRRAKAREKEMLRVAEGGQLAEDFLSDAEPRQTDTPLGMENQSDFVVNPEGTTFSDPTQATTFREEMGEQSGQEPGGTPLPSLYKKWDTARKEAQNLQDQVNELDAREQELQKEILSDEDIRAVQQKAFDAKGLLKVRKGKKLVPQPFDGYKVARELKPTLPKTVYEDLKNIIGESPPNQNWFPPSSALSLIDEVGGFDAKNQPEFQRWLSPGFRIPQTNRNPFRTRKGRKGEGEFDARFGKLEWDEIAEILAEAGLIQEKNVDGTMMVDPDDAFDIVDDEFQYYDSNGTQGNVYTTNENWLINKQEKVAWLERQDQIEQTFFANLTPQEFAEYEAQEQAIIQQREEKKTKIATDEKVKPTREKETVPVDAQESRTVEPTRPVLPQTEGLAVQGDVVAKPEPAPSKEEQLKAKIESKRTAPVAEETYKNYVIETLPVRAGLSFDEQLKAQRYAVVDPDFKSKNNLEDFPERKPGFESISKAKNYIDERVMLNNNPLEERVEEAPAAVAEETPALELESETDGAGVTEDMFDGMPGSPDLFSKINTTIPDFTTRIDGASRNTVIKSASAPTTLPDGSYISGVDVWLDTDNNNQPYKRNYPDNDAWEKVDVNVDPTNITRGQLNLARSGMDSDNSLSWSTEKDARKGIEILGLSQLPYLRIKQTGLRSYVAKFNPTDPNDKAEYKDGERTVKLSDSDPTLLQELDEDMFFSPLLLKRFMRGVTRERKGQVSYAIRNFEITNASYFMTPPEKLDPSLDPIADRFTYSGKELLDFFDLLIQYGIRQDDIETLEGSTINLEQAILLHEYDILDVTLEDLLNRGNTRKNLEEYYRGGEFENLLNDLALLFGGNPSNSKEQRINNFVDKNTDFLIGQLIRKLGLDNQTKNLDEDQRFNKGSFPKSELSWPKAQDQVSEFQKNYKGLENVKFEVLRDPLEMDGTGITPNTKAVYDPRANTIYVFSEKHLDAADLEKTLQHETIGHFGLSKLLNKDDFKKVKEKVRKSRLQSKSFKELYDEVAGRYGGSWNANDDVIAEEVIAKMSETMDFDSKFEAIRDEIYAMIAKALRSIGLTKGEISQAEIRNLLRESEKRIREKVALSKEMQDVITRAEAMGFATGTTVYHGSVGDIKAFDPRRQNPAGHFGKGFYFTDSEYDAEVNYAGKEGESISREIDDIKEFAETDEEAVLNMNKRFGTQEPVASIIPAYLKMKNPFNLTKGNVWFEFEYEYDEDGDIIPDSESGTGMDLVDAIDTVAREFDVNANTLFGELEIWDGIEANELKKRLMMADEVMYVEDAEGNLASGEFVRRVIEELGYDGIIMDASEAFPNMNMTAGTKHYIVFKPTQIRSTEANFDPKQEASDLIYARLDDDVEKEGNTYNLADENLKQMFVRKIQDSFLRVQQLETAVAESKGLKEIPTKDSVYRQELLYPGKVENRMATFTKNELNPLIDRMLELKINLSELDIYLYAKHAEERNEYIASINEAMPDGGSGMTNAEANTILALAEKEGKTKSLEELSEMVYNITEGTRDLLQDGNLIEEEMVESWRENYENYVPLKGVANNESKHGGGTGKGFSVGGKDNLRAMGRKTKAETIVSQIVADRTEKLIRAEKNKIGRTFYDFVVENPNNELFEIFTTKNPPTPKRGIKTTIDPDTKQKVDKVVLNQANFFLSKAQSVVIEDKTVPKYFSVKLPVENSNSGMSIEEVLIEIKDPLLNLAMHRLGNTEMSAAVTYLHRYNRWLSMVNTQYNPVFVPTNFLRDLQTAVFAIEGEQSKKSGTLKGEKLTKDILKNTVPRVKSYYKFTRELERGKILKNLSKEEREDKKYFDEYLEDGAKTAFFYSKSVEETQKDIDKLMALRTGDATKRAKAKKTFEDLIGSYVEDMNSAVENGVRFSTYVEARKAGIDRETAAVTAKNLTVNFNKKGDWGQNLNAIYLFFNPAVQGLANIHRAIGTKPEGGKLNKAQQMAAAITAVGVLGALFNEGVSEDDEDGKSFYSKISDYEKERNIIIMNPANGKDYFKIPQPYGYNIFNNMGTIVTDVSMGNKTPSDAAWFMLSSVSNSFNPVGGLPIPTVAVAPYELVANRNWTGNPIYKTNTFGQVTPDSSQAMGRLNTSPTRKPLIGLTKSLNRITGGTENISGGIDISPDTLEHLIDFNIGGAGRFVTNVLDTSIGIARGDKVDAASWPGARRLYSQPSPYYDMGIYYDRREHLKQLENELKSLKTMKARDEFREDYPEYRMISKPNKRTGSRLSETEKQIKEYNEIIKEFRNSSRLTKKEIDLKVEIYQDKINSVMQRFNKKYNEYVNQ